MKRLAVTDLHADVHALQDALTQIERLACDAIVCAGEEGSRGHARSIGMIRHYDYFRLLAASRKNTEDRAEVFEVGDDLVLVVADGAGGMRGGSAASDAVLSEVARVLAEPAFDVQDGSSWEKLFVSIDVALAGAMAGETTAVVVVVTASGLLGVSSGDSQAWCIGERDIDDLTAGQNRRRLGSGRAIPVSFLRPRLEGTLVVASDGLFNYAAREKIAAVRGHEPADAAERLRALVQLPSGTYQDDVGLVVVAAALKVTAH